MSCVRSLLLVLFVAFSVRAETVVIIQGTQAWYLPDGSSIAQSVDRLIQLGGGQPIPNGSELRQLSSTWTSKVSSYEKRNHHRKGLQTMYSVLGKQAADGVFSDLEQLQKRTQQTRDLILGPDKSKWDPWGQPIAVYLAEHVSSVAEASVSYLEISAGLDVPGEAIGLGWTEVVEIIIKLLGEGPISPQMLALIKILLNLLAGGS